MAFPQESGKANLQFPKEGCGGALQVVHPSWSLDQVLGKARGWATSQSLGAANNRAGPSSSCAHSPRVLDFIQNGSQELWINSSPSLQFIYTFGPMSNCGNVVAMTFFLSRLISFRPQ